MEEENSFANSQATYHRFLCQSGAIERQVRHNQGQNCSSSRTKIVQTPRFRLEPLYGCIEAVRQCPLEATAEESRPHKWTTMRDSSPALRTSSKRLSRLRHSLVAGKVMIRV